MIANAGEVGVAREVRYTQNPSMRAGFLAILLLLTRGAHADPTPYERERAALAAIDLGKQVPRYLGAKAIVQIEGGLAAAGYDVLPSVQVRPRLTGDLAACRDGACVRLVGHALNVQALVFASFDRTDENIVITMRLYDAATGRRESEVREVCDLCGEAEFSERLAVAASTLRARAVEARERREQLTSRSVSPAPGEPARSTASQPASRPASQRRSMIPGAAVGAAGALALGGGIYLLAINGRGACSPGDEPVYPARGAVIRYPDPANQDSYICRDVYHTKAVGLATSAIGVVALAAGVALVVRARGHDTVEVSPVIGGAQVKASISW
jgi:hypothetical protein